MKFLCSNCKAKYQISDDKVAGRTLRMTCRKCREEIVIRGEPHARQSSYSGPFPGPGAIVPPPPAAASPLMADWNARLAAGASATSDPRVVEWHVAINDIPVGPMHRDEIARKMAGGAVGPASLAWREGLDDWVPIAQIPELSVLLPSSGRGSLPPAPPQIPLSPAQRMEAVPLGGRAGAGAFSSEEWNPPPDTSPSQVARNPALDVSVAPPRSGGPTFGLVFAVLGFALLMTVVAIVGAGWLRTGENRTAAVSEPAPEATRQPVLELPEPLPEDQEGAEEEPDEMVIDLESLERERTKKGAGSSGKAPSRKPNGKQLTAEQKAMLERMGGTGAGISNLETRSSDTRRSNAQRGGLTASQLSRVVSKGKANLQRCYETALRGSGRDDTVRMDISLTVSASGNVTKVNASGQGLPGMDNCIERTVRMWRFPASEEGAQTKFPIVFSPGG